MGKVGQISGREKTLAHAHTHRGLAEKQISAYNVVRTIFGGC